MKILLVLAVLLFTSCSAEKEKVLQVGTNAEFAPFEYLEGNEVVGFDIDLIEEVAEEMGIEIGIQNLTWEGLLPALQGKKIDLIISGMTVTPDREKIVNFTTPYFTSPEQYIIVNEDNLEITGLDSLNGKSLGVVLGFTGDTIATELESVLKQNNQTLSVERFNSAFAAISALQSQKIDAILLDNLVAVEYQKTTPGLKLISSKDSMAKLFDGNSFTEEYAIALRKEDTELLTELNEALQEVLSSDDYTEIYQKYFSSK